MSPDMVCMVYGRPTAIDWPGYRNKPKQQLHTDLKELTTCIHPGKIIQVGTSHMTHDVSSNVTSNRLSFAKETQEKRHR